MMNRGWINKVLGVLSKTSVVFGGSYTFGKINYATASGTDTYTATLSPAPTALVTGADYHITFTNANTSTTPTLNLNSLGAKTIKKEGSAALVAGDIPAGHAGILRYDGTDMILTNPKWPGAGTLPSGVIVPLGRMQRVEESSTDATTLTTVDLGTVNSGDRILVSAIHKFTVTGTGGSVNFQVIKLSGTCTLSFYDSLGGIFGDMSPGTTGTLYLPLSGVVKVTGTGTCVLRTAGGNGGTTGYSSVASELHAIVLNNG